MARSYTTNSTFFQSLGTPSPVRYRPGVEKASQGTICIVLPFCTYHLLYLFGYFDLVRTVYYIVSTSINSTWLYVYLDIFWIPFNIRWRTALRSPLFLVRFACFVIIYYVTLRPKPVVTACGSAVCASARSLRLLVVVVCGQPNLDESSSRQRTQPQKRSARGGRLTARARVQGGDDFGPTLPPITHGERPS